MEMVKPCTSVIFNDLARLACGPCQVHVERIKRGKHVQTTTQEFSLSAVRALCSYRNCVVNITPVGGKTTTYMICHQESLRLQERVIQTALGEDTLSC